MTPRLYRDWYKNTPPIPVHAPHLHETAQHTEGEDYTNNARGGMRPALTAQFSLAPFILLHLFPCVSLFLALSHSVKFPFFTAVI